MPRPSRLCLRPVLGLLVGLAVTSSGCQAPRRVDEPLGQLPDAVTSAEPLWIPYRVMAGQAYQHDPREARLAELRRVTFDGRSGRPVWHPDSRHLVFERGEPGCGDLVKMDLTTGATSRLSSESGAAGLGGYVAEPHRLAFVRSASPSPPCRPQFALGAPRWTPPDADVWVRGPHAEPPRALLPSPGAELELATSPRGQLVFTSLRDGDPELYLARADGTALRRLTHSPGYDGGASLSPDGTRLVWHREAVAERPDVARLAAEDAPADEGAPRGEAEPSDEPPRPSEGPAKGPAIAPDALHLMVAGAAGQHPRALGELGRYDVEPSFLPDSRRILFSSDYDAPPDGPTSFDLYLTDALGAPNRHGAPAVERVTYHPGYDGQAVVSPDGRWIAFASTRAAMDDGPGPQGRTDIFVARWREVD